VNLTPCRYSDSRERQHPAVDNGIHIKRIRVAKVVLESSGVKSAP
jgi:hypothetical protein